MRIPRTGRLEAAARAAAREAAAMRWRRWRWSGWRWGGEGTPKGRPLTASL